MSAYVQDMRNQCVQLAAKIANLRTLYLDEDFFDENNIIVERFSIFDKRTKTHSPFFQATEALTSAPIAVNYVQASDIPDDDNPWEPDWCSTLMLDAIHSLIAGEPATLSDQKDFSDQEDLSDPILRGPRWNILNYPAANTIRYSWKSPLTDHFSDKGTRALNEDSDTGTWFAENLWEVPGYAHVMCSLSHVLPDINHDYYPGDVDTHDVKDKHLTSYELFLALEAIFVACGRDAAKHFCTIPVQIISVERRRVRFVQAHFEGDVLRVFASHYASLGKADEAQSWETAIRRIVQWAHPVPLDGTAFLEQPMEVDVRL
ncbi:hypothetical protein KEM56_001087 [Ascosphaera pollenicola]|nr:hypothetical protein KEM56_001087 [Ascosphaera pollenicola]